MNLQWGNQNSKHRTGRRVVAVGLVTAALVGGGGCGDESTETGSEGRLSPTAAYELAVDETRDDPALTEPLPRDTFDTLARVICEQLDEGGSPDSLLAIMSETPTKSGKRLRPESVRAIASAGVRAHCPRHASKLQ